MFILCAREMRVGARTHTSHRRDIPLFCILNAADGAEGKIEQCWLKFKMFLYHVPRVPHCRMVLLSSVTPNSIQQHTSVAGHSS